LFWAECWCTNRWGQVRTHFCHQKRAAPYPSVHKIIIEPPLRGQPLQTCIGQVLEREHRTLKPDIMCEKGTECIEMWNHGGTCSPILRHLTIMSSALKYFKVIRRMGRK
jgi:hypothetical protein